MARAYKMIDEIDAICILPSIIARYDSLYLRDSAF